MRIKIFRTKKYRLCTGYLFFMLNKLEDYNTMQDFEKCEIEKFFIDFKQDKLTNKESFGLIKKYKIEDLRKYKKLYIKK